MHREAWYLCAEVPTLLLGNVRPLRRGILSPLREGETSAQRLFSPLREGETSAESAPSSSLREGETSAQSLLSSMRLLKKAGCNTAGSPRHF